MTTGAFLTIIFILGCIDVTHGQLAVDCCLKVSENKIPKHIVRGYIRQSQGEGCNINAVVFITRKDLRLCAPPHLPWVTELIVHLQDLMQSCLRSNFKGKKCKNLRLSDD